MSVLEHPWFLALWLAMVVGSLHILQTDLAGPNRHLGSVMKAVWALTVLYSGPVGLGVYWLSGRKQIADDDLWRRAFRSVAHCYSGCGLGEAIGLVLAVGLLRLGGGWSTVALTFTCAFAAGLALSVFPLLQDGVELPTALRDSLIAEAPSILVMEVVAIGTDLWLAGSAGAGDIRFWTSLVVSLSAGLIAAYPVNYLLLQYGIKEGMHDPRHAHAH